MRPPTRPAARTSLPRLAAAGLTLSLLSGCASKDLQSFLQPVKQTLSAFDEKVRSILPTPGTPPENDGEGPPTSAPSPGEAAVASRPVADATTVPAKATPSPATQTAALPPPRLTNVPALRATSELIGLESTTVEQRLGSPALRRRDAPAELWQYRSPLCVMDLFLYSEGGSFRVTHVELHSRSAEQVQAPSCLASFGPEARPSPTSG
jgi:hypothetical protein